MNSFVHRKYILITPLKNEIKFLPEVLNCVINQTIPPALWIFVDDGSTDGSYEFLEEWTKKVPWLRVIRLEGKKKREIGFHYSEVVAKGFEYFKKIWNESFEYIGILDADIVLPHDYFERLIEKFEIDKTLGIASGIVVCQVGDKRIWEKEPPEWPCGAARLWTKECFEKTGWKLTRAPDSVSTARAMSLGYKTRNFPDLIITHLRPTWSGSGFWYGFIDIGKSRYYLGYDPIFILFASLKYTFDYPHIGTIPFLFGYFSDFIKYKKRIEDKTVVDFFKKRLTSKLNAWLRRKLNRKEWRI
ncbi:MAG: glycosyltransferase family 2 protein [candidate division WOR-3 bacterium]